MNNYHIDAIEDGKHGYKRKKLHSIKPTVVTDTSVIESDKRNLHNVFGMPLRSHWVFRGSPDQYMTPQNNGNMNVPNIVAKARASGESPRPMRVKNPAGSSNSGIANGGESPKPRREDSNAQKEELAA